MTPALNLPRSWQCFLHCHCRPHRRGDLQDRRTAVHWRCGSPNLRLAALLICSSVPIRILGPHLVRWITPRANIETFLMGCIGIATLLAATTYCLAPLHAVKTKREESPSHFKQLYRASAAYPSRWRTRRTPGRCHLGRVRFAHHGHPASALPRVAGSPTCRHGPDAGSAAGLIAAAVSNILINGLDWRIAVRSPSARFPAACSVQRSRP